MSAVTDPLHKIEEALRRARVAGSDVSRIMSAPTQHTLTCARSPSLSVSLPRSVSLVYRPFAHSWQHLIIEKEATIRQFAQFASLHLPSLSLPLPLTLSLVLLALPCRVSRSLSSRRRRRRRQSPVPARPVQMFVDKFTDVPSVLCESLSLSLSPSLSLLADAITRSGGNPVPA